MYYYNSLKKTELTIFTRFVKFFLCKKAKTEIDFQSFLNILYGYKRKY